MGCVDLVDIVAPGRGEAFEEEQEEDVLLAACNKKDHNAVIFLT